MAVYAALTEPGDTVMTIPQPVGGHSSNRYDGPAGIRGLNIVDVPFDPRELEVDLAAFAAAAREARPRLVALGASMTLFPLPVREIADDRARAGTASVFFDGAHQLGLIAGGQFQDPLAEGADVLTGSAGKTFSGPQSGVMAWNDPELTQAAARRRLPGARRDPPGQPRRRARRRRRRAARVRPRVHGRDRRQRAGAGARAATPAASRSSAPTRATRRTHQVIADVRSFGGGLEVAHRLAESNIITNKNLLPDDQPTDWDRPSGLRIGTTEVTRLGMGPSEMEAIADLFAAVLVDGPQRQGRRGARAARRLPAHPLHVRGITSAAWRSPPRSICRRWTASSAACCGWRRASSTTRTACGRTAPA